ncbi:MAG: CehA/McbA family metallohydrolase [Polyangiaceae bacterium]
MSLVRARVVARAALLLGAAAAAACRDGEPGQPGTFADPVDASAFLRGNLHAHSTLSDGDHTPEEVLAWYRDHGYAFAALTEHNLRVDPARYDDPTDSFVVIAGEEVTMVSGGKPIHVNALCHGHTIGGGELPTARAAIRHAAAEVRALGGVALLNHPNFEWALSTADVASPSGVHLVEVWSGHPWVRPGGDERHVAAEVMWEAALDAGLTVWGAAVDDMHQLAAGADPTLAGPGRAWVEVYDAERTAPAICSALAAGRFYFSGGLALRHLRVRGDELRVEPAAPARVELLGRGGATLASSEAAPGAPAVYRLRGGEDWVRARLTGADGSRAWTQPFRVRD